MIPYRLNFQEWREQWQDCLRHSLLRLCLRPAACLRRTLQAVRSANHEQGQHRSSVQGRSQIVRTGPAVRPDPLGAARSPRSVTRAGRRSREQHTSSAPGPPPIGRMERRPRLDHLGVELSPRNVTKVARLSREQHGLSVPGRPPIVQMVRVVRLAHLAAGRSPATNRERRPCRPPRLARKSSVHTQGTA